MKIMRWLHQILQIENLHGNAKESMDGLISFLFKEFLVIFKKYVPRGMFFTNQHLLVLDGHGVMLP